MSLEPVNGVCGADRGWATGTALRSVLKPHRLPGEQSVVRTPGLMSTSRGQPMRELHLDHVVL